MSEIPEKIFVDIRSMYINEFVASTEREDEHDIEYHRTPQWVSVEDAPKEGVYSVIAMLSWGGYYRCATLRDGEFFLDGSDYPEKEVIYFYFANHPSPPEGDHIYD